MSDALIMEMDSAVPADIPALTSEERARAGSVWIVAVGAGLMAIGAVATFSASAASVAAGTAIDQPVVLWPPMRSEAARQLAFVVAGAAVMILAARIPYTLWSAGGGLAAAGLLAAAMAVCSLVFVPGLGVEVNGAVRWLKIPGTASRFQPSELLKIALPIFLANWTVHRVDVSRFFRGLLPLVLVTAAATGIVGVEDFGTAALLAAVAGAMFLVAGARIGQLALMATAALPALAALILTKPHRIERLIIFRDPFQDATGAGYQVIQSLCTIVSGGWWGRGLGNGLAKGYLPEARNDFIFAVICEELGAVGGIAVIGLLITLMWLGRGVVGRCNDPVGRLLAFGIVLTLGVQAVMNIAVVTACVPTKGIALPLVSAGGSGTVFLGAMVGVLANIARKTAVSRQ